MMQITIEFTPFLLIFIGLPTPINFIWLPKKTEKKFFDEGYIVIFFKKMNFVTLIATVIKFAAMQIVAL